MRISSIRFQCFYAHDGGGASSYVRLIEQAPQTVYILVQMSFVIVCMLTATLSSRPEWHGSSHVEIVLAPYNSREDSTLISVTQTKIPVSSGTTEGAGEFFDLRHEHLVTS